MIRRSFCVIVCFLAVAACEPGAAPASAPSSTPTLNTPGPTVAELMRRLPTPGQSVEVDAYFTSGAGTLSIPPPPAGQVMCPLAVSFLADQSFPANLYVLNSVRGNEPPADAAWLIPTTPEAIKPGVVIIPELPYYSRLRGHFGDPAFKDCQNDGRIFVVEAVVTTYIAGQLATPMPGLQRPTDMPAWVNYHNVDLGYSLPYPPGWSIEPLSESSPGVLSAVAFRAPQWPNYPMTVRVHDRETMYDPYDSANLPPLMNGASGFGVFEQGLSFNEQTPESAHLAGYEVDRPPATTAQTVAVLFNGGGRTYELSVTYPLGFDAPQALLTAYSAMVESFRLDVWPGPTATPPIKQSLGPGPFLTQAQALAILRERNGPDLELVDAGLISEAAARQGQSVCASFSGHADGVWLMTVRGTFEGSRRTMRMLLDAVSGAQLCGEELVPDWTPAPDAPGMTDTPVAPASVP